MVIITIKFRVGANRNSSASNVTHFVYWKMVAYQNHISDRNGVIATHTNRQKDVSIDRKKIGITLNVPVNMSLLAI